MKANIVVPFSCGSAEGCSCTHTSLAAVVYPLMRRLHDEAANASGKYVYARAAGESFCCDCETCSLFSKARNLGEADRGNSRKMRVAQNRLSRLCHREAVSF